MCTVCECACTWMHAVCMSHMHSTPPLPSPTPKRKTDLANAASIQCACILTQRCPLHCTHIVYIQRTCVHTYYICCRVYSCYMEYCTSYAFLSNVMSLAALSKPNTKDGLASPRFVYLFFFFVTDFYLFLLFTVCL